MSRTMQQQEQLERLIDSVETIIVSLGMTYHEKARAILALPNIGIIDSDQTASIANFQCLKLIPKE